MAETGPCVHLSWRRRSCQKAGCSWSSGRCAPARQYGACGCCDHALLINCTAFNKRPNNATLPQSRRTSTRASNLSLRQTRTTCWECRKCRPRETSSAMLRPRRHQQSGCAAPLPCDLLCSALNRSPPCAANSEKYVKNTQQQTLMAVSGLC